MASYTYHYFFYQGRRLINDYRLVIDKTTQRLAGSENTKRLPEWLVEAQSQNACGCCNESGSCQALSCLAQILTKLDNLPSPDTQVRVCVEAANRSYEKRTTVQNALISLVGLALPFSGCPALSFFRPMGYFHLPFASVKETVFRVIGTHYLWKYYQDSNEPDSDDNKSFSHAELVRTYSEVEAVNQALIKSLKKAPLQESSALITVMNFLTSSVKDVILSHIEDLQPYFIGMPESGADKTDISDDKSFIQKLRLQKDPGFLRHIIDTVQDPVFVKDSKHRWIEMNEAFCEFIGHERSMLIGKTDYDVFPKEQADVFWRKDDEVLRSRGSNLNEEVLTDADGNTHTISTKKAVFRDAFDVDYLVGVIRDITEYKELEKKAIQAEKMQAVGLLASGIAHEINTPAQFVSDNLGFLSSAFPVFTELLDIARNRPDDIKDFLKKNRDDLDLYQKEIPDAVSQSQDGVKRISDIVVAMKDFSAPPSLAKQAFDINKAIKSTAAVSRNEWKYVAELKLELDTGIVDFKGYRSEFNQMLLNLIVNSSHAIGERKQAKKDLTGTIVISTVLLEGFVELKVSDNGIGISDKDINHIFEPFFTTKVVGKGTGQGLSIVYDIVEKHDGDIYVESSVGRGTVFTIVFPQDEDE